MQIFVSRPVLLPFGSENHPCALVFFSPLLYSVYCSFSFSIAVHIITRADSPAIISRTRRYRRTSNKRSRCDVCARSIDLYNNVHPHDYTSRAKSRYLQRSVKTNVRARERASKRRRHGARARAGCRRPLVISDIDEIYTSAKDVRNAREGRLADPRKIKHAKQ